MLKRPCYFQFYCDLLSSKDGDFYFAALDDGFLYLAVQPLKSPPPHIFKKLRNKEEDVFISV